MSSPPSTHFERKPDNYNNRPLTGTETNNMKNCDGKGKVSFVNATAAPDTGERTSLIEDIKSSLCHDTCITDEHRSLGALLLESDEHEAGESQKRHLQSLALETAPSTTNPSGARMESMATPVDIEELVKESLRLMSLMRGKDLELDDPDSRLDSDEEDALRDSIHLAKVRCNSKRAEQEKKV
jgi:hypothetical protein